MASPLAEFRLLRSLRLPCLGGQFLDEQLLLLLALQQCLLLAQQRLEVAENRQKSDGLRLELRIELEVELGSPVVPELVIRSSEGLLFLLHGGSLLLYSL